MSAEPIWFVEQTDFALRFARCLRRDRSAIIEVLKEVPVVDIATVPEAVRAVIPAGQAVTCGLRPKSQRFRLASAEEAKRHAGFVGIARLEQAAATPDMTWLAAIDAATGAAPSATRWFAAVSPASAYHDTIASIASLALNPARCVSGTLATVGALAATVNGPTLLLEIGEDHSEAFLVDRSGVVGAVTCSLSRDKIVGAVQSALGLKFRGSAGKLFFNPAYDFSEAGPTIGTRLAEELKTELAGLLAGPVKPTALYSGTLPAGQQWLVVHLASSLGLAQYAPEAKAWGVTGVSFADPATESTLSPAWFGFVHLVNAQILAGAAPAAWAAEWRLVEPEPAPSPGKALQPSARLADAPVNAGSPGSASIIVSKPSQHPAPVSSSTSPKPAASVISAPDPLAKSATAAAAPVAPDARAVAPNAGAKSNAPVALKSDSLAKSPAAAVTGGKPATSPATPAPNSGSSSNGTPPKSQPAPKIAAPTKPGSQSAAVPPSRPAAESKSPVAGSSVTYTTDARPKRAKIPYLLPVAAAFVLLGLVGFFIHSQRAEAARLVAEKQATEQRLRAEQAKAQLAEQKARDEAEAREKTAREFSAKLSAAEAARLQAENEAQAQAAARAANARGTLAVATEPAGARVQVGDLPARTSPATFADIKTGRYPVVVSLAGYDEVKLDLQVNENATTNPGTITLVRAMGTIEITSSPAGTAYELRPANALLVDPNARRTGRTPAKLDDLVPDTYLVTLTRDGWQPHAETVTLARGATAQVSWDLPTGLVKLTSDPEGATIRRNGVQVGTTPLDLGEQAPGPAEFELSRPDYDQAVTVQGLVEGGKVLELVARFRPEDRIYTAGEFDSPPEAINAKTPTLPYYLTLAKGHIEVEVTVTRDGAAKSFRVISTTNPDYTKYALDALRKWRFRPAVFKGQPVNARVSIPFAFKAMN